MLLQYFPGKFLTFLKCQSRGGLVAEFTVVADLRARECGCRSLRYCHNFSLSYCVTSRCQIFLAHARAVQFFFSLALHVPHSTLFHVQWVIRMDLASPHTTSIDHQEHQNQVFEFSPKRLFQ
jgi:hypothetical protein